MNKRIALGSAGLLVLAIIGLVLFSNDKQNTPDTSNSASSNSGSDQIIQRSVGQGSYVDYSERVLAETKGTRILFFHASWCPQCRALDADIKKQGVPADITILKVDYDKAQDLRKKYGVTLQTTVVKIDDSGNLISKFTPYEKPTLENALRNL